MKSEINNLMDKNLINLTFSEKFNTYFNIKDEVKILIIFFRRFLFFIKELNLRV